MCCAVLPETTFVFTTIYGQSALGSIRQPQRQRAVLKLNAEFHDININSVVKII